MTGHRLGDWTIPGPQNNVIAYYVDPREDGSAGLRLEWDNPPPLTLDDEAFYLTVIRPQVLERLADYLDRPLGLGLVVTFR